MEEKPKPFMIFSQMCAPIVISTEFFCTKNGEANGEAKFHASFFLWLVFIAYNVYYYYRHQIALYPKHQLKRKLNILLKGCIFYSAVQIPLSFALNSDRWIDYLFIISLNICFSIFYIKYFRYTCMLQVYLTGTYTFLICFAMGLSIQVSQLFKSIENEGRAAADHCRGWMLVLLLSIFDWFYVRKQTLVFTPFLKNGESPPPISSISSKLYNIV